VNYIKTLHDQILAMLKGFVQALPALVIALVVVVATWIVSRFAVRIADRLTRNTHMRENLKQLVETLVRLAIWIVGLLIAATIAMPGLTPSSLIAGLGIGAVAIGFAFQDIFQNFLAGVLIMIREKMRIGDIIECQGIVGRVERIMLRETHVRALSNELTIVPNSVLFKNPVKIQTDSPMRRFELVVSVPEDTDLDQATAAIRAAVEGVEKIAKDRGVDVFAQELKPGTIDLLVRWWAGSRPRDMRATRDAIIRSVRRAIAELPKQKRAQPIS
jgi:small-conductance mechanosensitive channel